MRERFEALARQAGFPLVRVMRPEPMRTWRERVDANPDTRDYVHLEHDPRALMPGCRSVIVMAFPYQPFALEPPREAYSAYYIASNASYNAVSPLCDWLRGQGYLALSNPRLPIKALAARAGIGRYGRNGIIAGGQFGSRIALQCILTDAAMKPDEPVDPNGFSADCQNCCACVKACPVGALKGDGLVDVTRCLRALPMGAPYADEIKPLIGASLLGCDLCQDCCRRNACIARVPIGPDIAAGMRLERLLRGDIGGALPLVGKNYARAKRAKARACLVAANLGRRDLIGLIEPLTQDESDLVADAARWALLKLT